MEVDSAMALLDLNEKKRRLSQLSEPEDGDVAETSESIGNDVGQPRRSTRKKHKECDKRRVLLKPKKLEANMNLKDVHNYYLDKKVKLSQPSLETIFEEPQSIKGKFLSIGPRKFKRSLNFNLSPSLIKQKVKKRAMKCKKFGITKKSRRRISMQILLDKLSKVDED